ncbi:hypothetical protein BDY24DRAFT_399921 [Mrakia frigida]|uniref:GMC family oxidoreductase n=1 Tax=Mrakia frigida TaxID=29902 RepID=UPI003FCBFB6E
MVFPSSSLLATTTTAFLALSSFSSSSLFVEAAPNAKTYKRSITTSAADLDGKSFDFIIAGGGLAGLALAARLSENANMTVAVIEAGTSGEEYGVEEKIDIPGYSYLNSLTGPTSPQDWNYQTVEQTFADSKTRAWPRGKVLGGSGAVNGMFWCRGSDVEYDAWNTLNPNGTQDWGWSEMTKYINKAETFHLPTDEQIAASGYVGDASVHGTDGPIQAGYSAFWYEGVNNWIPSWKALGFDAIDGAGGNNRGVSITPSTLNPVNQTRSDSKAGYIDILPPRDNLVILTGFQVTDITWSSTETEAAVASGVNFQATAAGQVYNVKANKEVILSGGTIGSAQILQLSGVGPSTTLTPLGIDVVVDIPVGYNLQDHLSNTMYWSTPPGTVTWGTLRDNTTVAAAALANYQNGDYTNSQWTYVNEAIGYISLADIMPNNYTVYAQSAVDFLEANVDAIQNAQGLNAAQRKGIEEMYKVTNGFLTNDVGQLEILLTMLGGGTTVGIQVAHQHPYTRGTVLINSRDAFVAPTIDPRYYGHQYDIDLTAAGLVWAKSLAAAAPNNEFMIEQTYPTADVTGDALETWFKAGCTTEYHILGTCSMLPRDSGGVVDTNLVVYGTKNVRVVDASIMPLQVSAHLMAPAYGVAEKAADIIKKAYELVVVESSSMAASTATSASSNPSASAAVGAGAGAGSSNAAASTTSLSAGAKGGIIGGVVGGVAIAAIIGLIAFFRRRKAKAAAANEKSGWYADPAVNGEDEAWDTGRADSPMRLDPLGAGAAGAGVGGAVAGLRQPQASFHSGLNSNRASYNTLDMAQQEPMSHSNSGYYDHEPSPYSDGGHTPPGPNAHNSNYAPVGRR